MIYPNIAALLAALPAPVVMARSQHLTGLFAEAGAQLPLTDVQATPGLGRAAQVTPTPLAAQPFRLDYDPHTADLNWLVASILHELIHVSTERNYQGAAPGMSFLNINLPPGLAGNAAIRAEMNLQEPALIQNLNDAVAVVAADNTLPAALKNHVLDRLNNYALPQPLVHYDTVLADILAYMEFSGVAAGSAYDFIVRLTREAADRRLVAPLWGAKRVRRVDRAASWWHIWAW